MIRSLTLSVKISRISCQKKRTAAEIIIATPSSLRKTLIHLSSFLPILDCTQACVFENPVIFSKICHLEFRQTALFDTKVVAGAPHLKVLFTELESIRRGRHYIDSLFRILRFRVADECTVTLYITSAHPAPQLMQGRETETFGVENYHVCGIRDVYGGCDHRCGDKHSFLETLETAHAFSLLSRFHAPVHQFNLFRPEVVEEHMVDFLDIFKVQCFGLFNQRSDDISTVPPLHFRGDGCHHFIHLIVAPP